MKANELRVGNLVERDGNILEVIRVAKDGIVNYDLVIKSQGMHVNSGNVIPIPLTEEWLLKRGIGKQNGYPYKFLNGYLKLRNGVYFFKYYDLEVELPFVHTIQNLFFALTGEELKINL